MTPRRVVPAAACAILVLVTGVLYVQYFREAEARLDPGDLIRRTALSNPDWANYQEDIKAEIGAAPVAQWQGRPVTAEHLGSSVRVTFKLTGPWADREVVIPVLLRDPLGHDRRHRSYEIASPNVTYVFPIGESVSVNAVPWIMLKYPHHEERLTLDSDGRWSLDRTSPGN